MADLSLGRLCRGEGRGRRLISTHGSRIDGCNGCCFGSDALGSSRIGSVVLHSAPGATSQLAAEPNAVASVQRVALNHGATQPKIPIALLHELLDGSAVALIHRAFRSWSEDRRWD